MKYGIKSSTCSLTLIVISTFFILMIAFRSILIPIKAILMNIVGLSATFGILVYIFQYGHFGLGGRDNRANYPCHRLQPGLRTEHGL